MAEEDSSQEKTEEPTPKRKQKAREEGQVPRSKELSTTAVILAGSLGLLFFGGLVAETVADVMRESFSLDRDAIFDTRAMFTIPGKAILACGLALAPFFIMILFASIAGPVAIGGFLFSGKAIQPKLNRMNPISGLKRMFSVKSLVELVKSIGKVAVVIAVAYVLLLFMKHRLLGLSSESVNSAIIHSLELSLWAAVILSASTIVIALIDVPFQIYDHNKKMKMSRQEVKDELKDSEGKPEVKSKIRQLQMQMAQQRMMSKVPEADVVITNPTHFSVALKYNPETMETPILLAKGVDHVALKIREIARANNIEFVQAPPLARAVYHSTELDQPIPSGLYVAVAQVLAYVFQLREFRKGRGQRPDQPRRFDIPKELQF